MSVYRTIGPLVSFVAAHLIRQFQVVNYTGYSDSIWSSGHPKYHEKKQSFNLFAGRTNIKGNSSVNINKATYVPSVPPTKLEGCNIIDIRYFVKVRYLCILIFI